MKVKGTGLITTRDFVKSNFKSRYTEWLDSLTNQTKTIYSGVINSQAWFPIKDTYLDPLDSIVKLFYKNDYKLGGESIGAWSAETALRGVYKVFLFVATPQYLMSRATKIFSAYYEPCDIIVSEKGKKQVTIQITKFDTISVALEYRIAGWCKKALELTNCENVSYIFTKSLTKNDSYTEIIFSWS
jgi:hypothetical protein